ncbi:23 kDa integral membrane protein-like [Bicyclus anynana]|uniref:Tetraspanin n=1 Tax=Bicyclus anynana TaxID=110368 RepID=A0ABM3LF54_BICAN|nr:23 kDa integral membrane protein-like [Bicyclus anynana]
MGLQCGDQCIKYVLFIFNLLIVMISVVLLVVAAASFFQWSIITYQLGPFLVIFPPSVQKWIPWVVLVIGGCMFMISFLGCCGAIAENHCMVLMYSVILIVCVILEVTVGVVAYTQRHIVYDKVDEYSSMIGSYMNNIPNHDSIATLAKYGHIFENNRTYTPQAEELLRKLSLERLEPSQLHMVNLLEKLQTEFQCCGVHGAEDYVGRSVIKNLPNSCCSVDTEICRQENSNMGCWTKIEESKGTFIGIGIGFVCIEITTAILGLFLVNSIKNIKNNY